MTVNRRPSRSSSRMTTTGGMNHSNAAASSHCDHNNAAAAASTAPSSIPELDAGSEHDLNGDYASGSSSAWEHQQHSGACGANADAACGKSPSSSASACAMSAMNGVQSEADSDREANYEELKFPQPPPPKHIPFPDVPQQSEIVCEMVMFLYTGLAASAQFLHLYRSVWWLPESNTKHIVNFYLIDPFLVCFIIVLLIRRFLYCLLVRIIQWICPRMFYRYVLTVVRLLFFSLVITYLAFCCEAIFQKQGYNVIYICYPIIVYFITFGFRFEPFLRTTFECPKATYLNGAPLHCCSTNPASVRAEIESLRCDYNNRFKQVVFTTILNAYYAAFIPCCFAQSYLYYDIYWATQHLAFMIVGGFTMCTSMCFPANYCDVMHRAALHLGQWNRMEPSKYVIPARFWSKRVAWPGGMVVRYHGELYKATGVTTMAVPGCASNHRFFTFFQNPASLYFILAVVQLSVCLLQLAILYFVVEWHNVVSLAFLMAANYYTLYRIGRDFGVTQKVYAAEGSIYDKFTTAMHDGASENGGADGAGDGGGPSD